ncbi:hypothetical protein Tcan_09411 [Toxocara canis]|uniref:Uncharacterized protein n=1 Tax=Toxocara canis TaxID=6265 RepID=A0A0B2UTC5_TOXCA|nr:hypothetical protein Tcan_09411 [Toxocara canis]
MATTIVIREFRHDIDRGDKQIGNKNPPHTQDVIQDIDKFRTRSLLLLIKIPVEAVAHITTEQESRKLIAVVTRGAHLVGTEVAITVEKAIVLDIARTSTTRIEAVIMVVTVGRTPDTVLTYTVDMDLTVATTATTDMQDISTVGMERTQCHADMAHFTA